MRIIFFCWLYIRIIVRKGFIRYKSSIVCPVLLGGADGFRHLGLGRGCNGFVVPAGFGLVNAEPGVLLLQSLLCIILILSL